MNKNKNLDKDKLKEEAKDIADFNVKWFIIKDVLVQKSEVSVNNKDIDDEIKKILDQSNEDKKKIVDFFANHQNREPLSSNLLNEKLFEYISDFAVIKDTEKSTAELRKQK
jgi:FKBP-type peptidyl-prolyl cis-trans isomerase (trigger factor)